MSTACFIALQTMPEEKKLNTDVQMALCDLERHNSVNYASRAHNYTVIQTAINQGDNISADLLNRLLDICVRDMSTYSAGAVNLIAVIVSKIKMGTYDTPKLLQSALAVINMIKSIAILNNVDSLMTLSFKTLLSYPDDILQCVANYHEEVIELFNLCCHSSISLSVRVEVFNFLLKLLQILQQDKTLFVEKGISVWFSKVILIVMFDQTNGGSESDKSLEVLELLTEDLLHINYSDNPHWHSVLECICNKKQYPAVMKNLLNADCDGWHRLWIIFVKLLKHQITQSLSTIGSPINSMLPVVEAAFKLDAKKRTKAFECWNVLIDSFSSKINLNNLHKTLKLLIIPLKSNNARTEETILAKFKCWWHLLRKFQNQMDMFLDTVLVSFLHFCFGQDNTDKLIPGMISVNMKRMCNQALVDIVGHINCDGCTDLPQLKGKLINTKHLVDNWNHWIYSLTYVLKTANTSYGLTKQQTNCMWKSFILTIGELPENNIRKDLFASLMSIVITNFAQDSNTNNLDITFNILTMSLFDESTKIKRIFKSDNDLLMRIVKFTMDPSLDRYYKSLTTREFVTKLKPLMKLTFDEEVCMTRQTLSGVLAALVKNNTGLVLWTALAETLCESDYDKYVLITYNVLLWPLRHLQLFTEVKLAAMAWYTTYDLTYPILNKTDINNEILEACFTVTESNLSIVCFKLCISLGLLKHKFNTSNSICEKELKLLLDLTKTMNYEYFKPFFPLLIERIVAIMNIVASEVNDIVTALILVSVKNVLHMLTQAYTSHIGESHVMDLIVDLLNPLNKIFAVPSYAKLIPDIIYHLLKCFSLLSTQLQVHDVIISILKTILTTIKITDSNYNKIKSLIDVFEKSKLKTDTQLITPQTVVTKQIKTKEANTVTKEANIVKTVVENGEEYVVVKSNWKFNPRKLTENQKEKLQRKREDIPALYQDLSQSQDEFKLTSWRTDSQDNTSSSRSESKSNKSYNNETASDILNNLPNTNVVPRILENFFSENEKNSGNAKNSSIKDNTSKNEASLTTIKNTKSPRMALKDRVFRNVRNLIENSGIHKENQASSGDPNMINNKTPTHGRRNNLESAINSAPPVVSVDRPSRVKRKPKKFEDLLLLTSKKCRHSWQDIPSNKLEINNYETDSNEQTPAQSKDQDMSFNIEEVHTNNVDNLGKINSTTEDNLNTIVNNESVNISTDVNEKKEEDTNTIQSTLLNSEAISSCDQTSNINKKLKLDDCDNTLIDAKSCKELNVPLSNTSTDFALESRSNLAKNLKEKASPKTPKDIEGVLLPKISKDCKVVLISNIAVVNKETPIPKISKTAQALSTPEAIKVDEELSPSNTLKCDKEVTNLRVISAVNENLALNTPDEGKAAQTVNISNDADAQEKSSTKMPTDDNSLLVDKLNDNIDMGRLNSEQPKDTESLSAKISTSSATENVELTVSNTPKRGDDLASTESKESNVFNTKQTSKTELTSKKNNIRKSRIEKELAIDMVEGHPYLKIQSEKRLTRKTLESVSTGRRKSMAQKLNNTKLEDIAVNTPKNVKKSKEKSKKKSSPISIVVDDSQEKSSEPNDQSSFSDDLPCSEDVIESSQDSTITTISVKSAKKILKSIPFVHVEKIVPVVNKAEVACNSQSILEYPTVTLDQSISSNQKSNDDSILPLNKTVVDENIEDNVIERSQENFTENMDTKPLDSQNSGEVILVSDEVPTTVISSESSVGPETQEIAEADTQPTNLKETMDIDVTPDIPDTSESSAAIEKCDEIIENEDQCTRRKSIRVAGKNDTGNNVTVTLSESACADIEQSSVASSPLRDEAQRQKDFLNNTTEISPIKTMSPDRDKKSPSPETSSDYVVIKLTSPVQSNGEPFDKSCSPEVFTEDKVSPDKRDLSPPRVEVSLTNTSPSSSLSLKKNRPQVRSGGRAAQMLGLCVPDKVQTRINQEKSECDEVKKVTMTTTPVRRNLRSLYNSVNDNTDNSSSTGENDDSDNFLKFRRSLPTVDSSPSVSILKRKLAEITDDASISMNKRKRVSFHDPPVSTTVSVQKYIEPAILRSPQNSAQKRCERQLRQHTPVHSQKKLENVFKLHTVLTKAVEGFSESEVINATNDTQSFSLDETPVVEIVRASELNDTDPICPELIDCTDSIEIIAGDLSSSAMKSLFIKELEGKLETIGDLARMTELEVNRLCIKAPKVKVAKKVLSDYITKRIETVSMEIESSAIEANLEQAVTAPSTKSVNIEVQTDSKVSADVGLQTVAAPLRTMFSQTETALTAHTSAQTDESGSKSTADIITSCSEKPDFVEQLREKLEDSTIKQISEKLPLSSITDLLVNKITPSEANMVFNRILENVSNSSNDESKELLYIRDYLCNKFASRDLILFCSQILKDVSDKPV